MSLKAIESAINQLIHLDKLAINNIKSLNGKVVKLIVSPITIYISFNLDKIELNTNSNRPPDTTITAKPMALLKLGLLPEEEVSHLFRDEIKIEGDVEVGQKLKQLMDKLELDWEEQLSKLTGDIVAHQVGKSFRNLKQQAQSFAANFKNNLNEYLHEEAQQAPTREELHDFYQEVDELRLRVDRLCAHIEKIYKL